MSIRYFEGPAGTGKTTSLIQAIGEALQARPLQEGEKVLALTFMHGARRRLAAKLATVSSLMGRFECQTIDSLAYRLLQRWRTHAARRWGSSSVAADDPDFERNCQYAAALLQEAHIGRWLLRTYPLVVVDESQDCRDGRLAMLTALSKHANLLAACDEFQELTSEPNCPAGNWLTSQGAKIQLVTCHRTTQQGLLDGALALRSNQPLVPGPGLDIIGFPTAAMAVHKIATELFYNSAVTILCPTGPSKSRFIEEILRLLQQGPVHIKKLNQSVGPFAVRWEQSHEEDVQALLKALELPQGEGAHVTADHLLAHDGVRGCRELHEWTRQQARLRGLSDFPVEDVNHEAQRTIQRLRAHRSPTGTRHRAMTIHQAKNQEFRRVIVLWPYEVKDVEEYQRRLLYNAITRARSHTLVVVQNNPTKSDRLAKPPFVPNPSVVAGNLASSSRA